MPTTLIAADELYSPRTKGLEGRPLQSFLPSAAEKLRGCCLNVAFEFLRILVDVFA